MYLILKEFVEGMTKTEVLSTSFLGESAAEIKKEAHRKDMLHGQNIGSTNYFWDFLSTTTTETVIPTMGLMAVPKKPRS